MGRYANSSIRLDFPDLSDGDDQIYVTIRNPKTVPADTLMPKADVPLGPDGKPESTGAIRASYEVMAGLVIDWHVYDGTLDEDAPPLELPAKADDFAKLPFEIVQRLADELGQVLTVPR
jgi:hypothetical protein